MSNGLCMDYDDMETCCTQLQSIAQNILEEKTSLLTKVNTLCDAWSSEASPVYQQDFTTVGSQIDKIGELVNELTQSIQSYVNDMRQLDSAYAHR